MGHEFPDETTGAQWKGHAARTRSIYHVIAEMK